MSSLRPLAGSPAEVLSLLRSWQRAGGPPQPLVIETSGSTGGPKRVLLSRAAMVASAHATHTRLGGPGQWLLALPASYVAGAQVLLRSVLAGTTPVLADDHADFAAAAAAMSGGRRYVSLVPTQLRRLLSGRAGTDALRGFDVVLLGGAAADPVLRAQAEAAGVTVVATYGMSETCGGCVYDGLPLDGVGVAVGAGGRIRIAGPTLFSGYDGDPGLTARVLEDGWFLTSDHGRLDEDGRLHVLGRTDEVVVSGGVNVPTPAVAARLRMHERVTAAEVVGVPDDEWGRRVVAVVESTDPPPLAELRDWVSSVHPRSWAPRGVVTVPRLPLLGNGKVDRRAVERLAADPVEAS